ncbi:uncharacterized protein LOC103517269 [Diaphorina citri]|uniref:Uncharacterized protein LOC103517269 n=1 Tax=Diaphorina citri TaxID=121845 RepID=A0A3Q0J9P5_DIACI|nr:uncharacterized protein LOC103517269 [Diaphorina citri]
MNSKSSRSCLVPTCYSTMTRTPGKLFFHVPRNKEVKAKFLEAIKYKKTEILNNNNAYYICEDHFELEKDVEDWSRYKLLKEYGKDTLRLRLKPNVLPRFHITDPVNLDNLRSSKTSNNLFEMNTKTSRYCLFPSCYNSTRRTPDKLFFNIPKEKDMKAKFLEAIQYKDTKILNNSTPYYICEDHFELEEDVEDWSRYKLLKECGKDTFKPKLKPNVLPRFHMIKDSNLQDDNVEVKFIGVYTRPGKTGKPEKVI